MVVEKAYFADICKSYHLTAFQRLLHVNGTPLAAFVVLQHVVLTSKL